MEKKRITKEDIYGLGLSNDTTEKCLPYLNMIAELNDLTLKEGVKISTNHNGTIRLDIEGVDSVLLYANLTEALKNIPNGGIEYYSDYLETHIEEVVVQEVKFGIKKEGDK